MTDPNGAGGESFVPCGARHLKQVGLAPATYSGPQTIILQCQGPVGHAGEHIAVYGTAFVTWEILPPKEGST